MIINDYSEEIFVRTIAKYDNFIIMPHYNPDPDALGSAFGLQYLLKRKFHKTSEIYFYGMIGRAENKSMVNILEIPLCEIQDQSSIPDLPIILLDTQPGTGNNPLHKNRKPLIIIDHHPLRRNSMAAEMADIRPEYGSTSSIIYEYMKNLGVKPTINIATALYYGIQTDVAGEGRSGNKKDFELLESLSKYISRNKLYSIENPRLPFEYFGLVNKGMTNSVIYDDLIISSIGRIENPDYISELADFLIRFDKANTVMVFGIHKDAILISFRCQHKKHDAGLLLKKIVGGFGTAGGHAKNSGGRIIFDNDEDMNKITKKITTRAIEIIHGKITNGIPLLSLDDYIKI